MFPGDSGGAVGTRRPDRRRLRESFRRARERLGIHGRSLAQTALAAGAAWLLATELLGHPQPFFAPVAAIISLGVTVGRRGRRAVEMVFGVAIGIGIADALILLLGTGTLPLMLVVLLAMGTATAVGGGPILATQAATSAALVATLEPPTSGLSGARFLDALVGGAVALAVNALVLPPDPLRLIRRAAERVLRELAGTLEDVADALAARDAMRAERSLARARGIEPHADRLLETVTVAREVARITPGRRRLRGPVEELAVAATHGELALRNSRVLARGSIRALQLDDHVPPDVPAACRELARAVRELSAHLEQPRPRQVEEAALCAAALATSVLQSTSNLSVSVLVGQIRSAAFDLLRAVGWERDAALAAVRSAGGGADDRATARS